MKPLDEVLRRAYERGDAVDDIAEIFGRSLGSIRARAQTLRLRRGREKREAVLLTADEVADALGVTRRAVYKMTERGQLPGARRIGRRLRFEKTALDALIGRS